MKIYKAFVKKHFQMAVGLKEMLLALTKLSEDECRDAAEKGAVWIQRNGKGKILRIRSLDEKVRPQDLIQVNYDKKILSFKSLEKAECVYEDKNYGVWLKPAGVLPQGSQTSDHTSLLRYVEKVKGQEVFLVHRLDRETYGLMIIAYHSKAAGMLSSLFQNNKIHKEYEAIVLGEIERGTTQTISASLDDKEAVTHIEVLGNGNGKSHIKAKIETGRLHQIRRHLDFIGHPIMGDPKYGKGNKNREGLKLVATAMSFEDPWLRKIQEFRIASSLTV